MSDEIVIDSEPFISSKRASEIMDYTQDYIGQLSRSGQIKARRVGGLWYVSLSSLQKYKEQADSYRPEPPIQDQSGEPESLISFDGRDYISAARAAKITSYSPDYVGQLARGGSIPARQVGNRWYVDRAAILAHKKEKDALLRAVQVESVGLKHKELEKERLASTAGYAGPGPLLDYTRDERDLIPEVNVKPRVDVDTFEYERPIPIHIKPVWEDEVEEYGYEQENPVEEEGRIAGKSIYTLVLPVVATIVIVLSLGTVFFRNSSVYTQRPLKDGDGGAQVATAANTKALNDPGPLTNGLFERIGDSLEKKFVPELTYRRKN